MLRTWWILDINLFLFIVCFLLFCAYCLSPTAVSLSEHELPFGEGIVSGEVVSLRCMSSCDSAIFP
jgi:hypothetical protein